MTLSDQLQQGTLAEMRSKWGWFVALGVLVLALGIIAAGNLLVATVASVFVVGSMMIVAGVIEVIHAFGVKTWGTFFWWLLSGILYVIAGIFAFTNPLLTTAILTLLLAVSLIASGLLRVWVGFTSKGLQGWGWVVAGGVLTVLAGLVIAMGWPVNSLVILGIFLAVDLIFQGITYIAFGFGLRKAA